MKTIDKKNWNKLSGLMNYSLRSTILVICFVAITAQFNKVYAQSFKKFKLGLDIETGISGNGHGFIYNGMIHPLIPFAIKGVLWYQGESNAGRAFQYRSCFPLLISSWRKQWKNEFPFYFVQLSKEDTL